MTERRLPGGFNTADEKDLIQKGPNGIWFTRSSAEVIFPAILQTIRGWSPILPSGTLPSGKTAIAALRDATTESAIVSVGEANGTMRVTDAGQGAAIGTLTPTVVSGLAIDPTTGTIVAAVGTGWAYRSTNQGTTWTIATTKPAAAANYIVFGNSVFIAVNDTIAQTSPTGDVWTSRTPGLNPRGVAATKTGSSEFLLVGSQNAVVVSSNQGASWTAAGVLPDAAAHNVSTAGSLTSTRVGNEILPFFLANLTFGLSYKVYRGVANGSSWGAGIALPLPVDLSGVNAAQVRLIGDPDTGALLAVLLSAIGTILMLSLDGGITWPGYARVAAFTNGVAMANGRIFVVHPSYTGIVMNQFGVPLL